MRHWLYLVLAGCGFHVAASGGAGSDARDAAAVDAPGTIDGAIDGPVDGAVDAPVDAPAACVTDPAYTTRPGFTHRYRVGPSLSWPDARDACAADGAHLVVIEDALENTYVDSLATSSFWIGMSDIAVEGTFVWVTGAALTFTSWRAGQPNNDGGAQNCGEMDPNATGTWNDFTCPTAEPFVCECEP